MKKSVCPAFLVMSLCLVLCGCGGAEVLEEIPRDYVILATSAPREPEETDTEGTEQEGTGEEAAEADETSQEQVSFVMEEASGYAYSKLDELEQLWYRDMEECLGSFGQEQKLSEAGFESGMDETDIDRIFQCVLCDHPELFYVEGYSYTKYTRGEKTTSIEFSGRYTMDYDTALERKAQIEAAAAEILAGIDTEASDYEKVKYVYDNLIRETDYKLDSADNQNIYSVFINKASVCQGYAKATQYLLNRLGVECSLVLGTVDTGEGHAWNLVKADGSYYYVDTTWGDASYQLGEGETVSGYAMPEINYDYLCVTTAELFRTHSLGGPVPMPECVATEDNYYVRQGALFKEYDREQMTALFEGAVEQGNSDVTIKCEDEDCYEQICSALIVNQEIFDYLPETGGTVAYARNEKQLSLTFWVTNE